MNLIQKKTINVEGCPINILVAGDFSSTPLLFLHGKAFQAKTWQELGTLQTTIDAGFSTLALDLPGFGKTPQADINPEVVISEVMQAEKIKKAIIIAPSMSGKIGLEYSIKYPQKVAGLVLIGSIGIEENRARLHDLPGNTLILWGENDQISDPANGKLLEEKIEGSRLVVFKGANHPCYLEQPELWHQTLLNFAKTVVH
jgi:abhydrolase domain-containing protein 14